MRARTGAPRVATFYCFGLGLLASASPTQIGDGNPRGLSLTQKASEGPTSQEDPGSDSQDADPLPTTAGWKERPDELRRHADKKLPRPLGAHKRGQTSQAAFCTPGPPPTHPLGSGALLTPSSGPPGAERGPPAPGRHARPVLAPPPAGISALPAPARPLPRPAPHKGPLSRRVPGLWFLKSSRRKTEEIGQNGERSRVGRVGGTGPRRRNGQRCPLQDPKAEGSVGGYEKSRAP